MATQSRSKAKSLANEFAAYLFDSYADNRHVRRTVTWIGPLLKGIERAASPSMEKNRTRQVIFEYGDKTFKARYDHQAGSRGGIEVVEVLPGRGSPDGDVAIEIRSLDEAESDYLLLNTVSTPSLRRASLLSFPRRDSQCGRQ